MMDAIPGITKARKALLSACLIGVGFGATQPVLAAATDYKDHPKAKAFIEEMVEKGLDRDFVTGLIHDAKHQKSIIKAISRPAEKRLTWGEYRKIFLGQSRIDQGVEFWNQHRDTLRRASQQYGVPEEIIVAIIGVETRYGRHAGSYRVIDSLATLAFDYPPRSKFFTGQLGELMLLLQEQPLDPKAIKGSYAGAMGFGQFIPSSYRHYAVDFDADGSIDLLNNPVDAIGSVANYFKRHGWRSGQPVTLSAALDKPIESDKLSKKLKPIETLAHWRNLGLTFDPQLANELKATAMRLQAVDGEQHWIGLHNFYVITRYNHSRLYAMAVYQLSQEIAALKAKQQQVANG
ncbi:lytic murein transglycosylase B [Motiliproteus sp.]|uniref:lytic murein transglycosylase B n=1 Tax=Motiliproteus sp. TaxID=1898955 RepID=UPI003BAC966A